MFNNKQELRILDAVISVPKITSGCPVNFNLFQYTLKVVIYVAKYVQGYLIAWILTNLLPAEPGAPEG